VSAAAAALPPIPLDADRRAGAPLGAAGRWVAVCEVGLLQPERGVAALVEGRQIAVFRTFDGSLYAIDNRDPFSGAYVLSRGIVGTRGDAATVASPMFKQVFDLRTGECLDDDQARVATYPVRLAGVHVQVRVA
jgi:nitrite reductase (NADH) small subunit